MCGCPFRLVSGRGRERETDLVSRGQFGPWFVGSPVIILSVCYLHILIKPQNLPGK